MIYAIARGWWAAIPLPAQCGLAIVPTDIRFWGMRTTAGMVVISAFDRSAQMAAPRLVNFHQGR
jgi:hypothetical protein